MKELKIEEIDEIKKDSKSIVLIYAEGCSACENAKPFFDSIENKYDQFYFYKVKFSEAVLPFYNQYVPKEPVSEPFLDELGNQVFNENGQLLMKLKLDENNNIIMETQVKFPSFMVFINGFVDETNEHGFVGHIGGFDAGHVEFALSQMSEQKVG